LLIVQILVKRCVGSFLITGFLFLLLACNIYSLPVFTNRGWTSYSGDFFAVDTLDVEGRFYFVIFREEGGDEAGKRIKWAIKESIVDIAEQIGVEKVDTVRVYVMLREDRYRELSGSFVPEWSAGFSDVERKIVAINVKGISQTPYPLKVVVKHELSHILLKERTGRVKLPLWFIEGVAMWQAGQWSFLKNIKFAENFARGRVPYLKDLDHRFPYKSDDAEVCYFLSLLAVNYLFGSNADELATLTAFTRDKGSFETAFRITYGMSTEEFADRFHDYLAGKYGKFALLLQSIPYFSIIALLLVIAYMVKRYRIKRKLKEWEEIEEQT